MKGDKYDIIVIGGGIIGTAIAKVLRQKLPTTKIALIEKEKDLGEHQSSHNSRVIHAGIHYEPNSLKAKLCVEGADLIYKYCKEKNIPFKKYGKIIVATSKLDTYQLKELYHRGMKNKVPGLKLLQNWKDVTELQSNCTGLQALWSPNSGNIDWKTVTKSLGHDFTSNGGHLFLNTKVTRIAESTSSTHPLFIEVLSKGKAFLTKYVITCLGLYSGTLLKSNTYKNISLKVNYYKLNPKLNRFIKTNIYGLPPPDLPFLGIHFSPTLDGDILLGPTAVPAFRIDGYENEIDIDYVRSNLFSEHFRLLFLKNAQSCLNQVAESVSGDRLAKALRKFCPMVSKNDIVPGPTALQGQLVTKDGDFFDDFLIEFFEGCGIEERTVNCRFIPSPGATSSLAIANLVTNKILEKYG